MSKVPAELRATVMQRAQGRCEYCLLPQESQVGTFPVDHVLPLSRGGLTEFGNLALACARCNARKWTHVEAVDPDTGFRVPIFHPRVDVWGAHFRWSPTDPDQLEPLSAVGRATVALLDLNSPADRSIRGALRVLGLHPPQ